MARNRQKNAYARHEADAAHRAAGRGTITNAQARDVGGGEWRTVPGFKSTALFYPTGKTEPTWIISNAHNFDRAEDEAGQFHGKPITTCTWREDASGLPAVPEGFEDAWCAEIWPEDA